MFQLTLEKKTKKNSLAKLEQNSTKNPLQSLLERKTAMPKMERNQKTQNIQQQTNNKSNNIVNDLLEKMQKNTCEVSNFIGQTKQQSLNFIQTIRRMKMPKDADSRANDKQILIEREEDSLILWLGKVYSSCASATFQLFYKNQLTYNEAKAYCCEQILLNLLNYMKLNPDIEAKDLKFLNEQSCSIINHLCNKYPQTEQSDVNKKLKESLKSIIINNLENDDYDLVSRSGVQFEYQEDEDYTLEIMKFLNYVIGITSESKNGGATNLQIFQKIMIKIFTLVEHKSQIDDAQQVFEAMTSSQPQKYVKRTEEQIQYQQRVRSFTKYQIGNKLSQNLPLFSSQQIESGTLQTRSGALIRVIDKWVEQLIDKFKKSQKLILERSYRYKAGRGLSRKKLSVVSKKSLYKKVCEKLKDIKQFQQKVRSSIYQIQSLQGKLCKSSLQSCDYIPEVERRFGQFACKMELSSITYLVKSLNFYIHKLLQAVKNIRDQWNYQGVKIKDHYQYISLDISLVTFKVSDLLRCKFSSREEEILRILQTIKELNQNPNNKLLKIVRVKDRLNQGTRDILINAWFNETCLCEIQLAVVSTANQKQSYLDKFNHFLYELRRAQLGPIMEMSMIWVSFDPKSSTFLKAIAEQDKIRQFNRGNICKMILHQAKLTFKVQQFPFICQNCEIFFTTQKTMFENIRYIENNKSICGECFSTRIKQQMKKKIIFKYFLKLFKFFNSFLPHFKQINDLQSLLQEKLVMIIPRNSRRINYFIVKIVQIQNLLFLTNCLAIDKKIKTRIYHKINIQKQSEIQKLFKQFIVLNWDIPMEFVKLTPNVKGRKQLLYEYQIDIKQLGNVIQDIECLCLVKDENRLLFPFLNSPKIDLRSQLIQQLNIKKITQIVCEFKEVIEMNKMQMKPLIKQRINLTVKQVYLAENNIKNIDFVQQMTKLTVFEAEFNQIINMPVFPPSIQQIFLKSNKISTIESLSKANANLVLLDLENNLITSTKNSLNDLASLTEVRLLENPLIKCQKINNSPNITILMYGLNKMQKIQNIDNLQNLQILVFTFSNVQKIQNISKNTKLKSIYFSSLALTKLQNLQHQSKLSLLTANKNQISQIQGLQNLINLQILYLGQNLIQKITGLDKLINLKQLSLEENLITQIQGLSNLINLKILKLNNNKIQKIKNLQANEMLSQLDLSTNFICEIQGFQHLQELKSLNLSNNIILVLTNVRILKQLLQININNNAISQIFQLPPSIKQIRLKKNKITTMQWLQELSSQCQLDIRENSIPIFVMQTIIQIAQNKKINLII